jgi:SAM-dependent methyltransferase
VSQSLLVKIFGFPATLIHGDTLVLDRWMWLKKRLPITFNGESLVDIGCGTGAFTIGASLRGYKSLGLSWDERNQLVAEQRKSICNALFASFDILDVRKLDSKTELLESFDIAVCCENIEHILDDLKLMKDVAAVIKPGGRLLLTTPYYYYQAITGEDNGPFCKEETGWHVRRGYTEAMLVELLNHAGLIHESTSYISGFVSQKTTFYFRILSKVNLLMAWILILPLRIFPPIFDRVITDMVGWSYYSICIEAYKPRYNKESKKSEILKDTRLVI